MNDPAMLLEEFVADTTLDREPLLTKPAALKASRFLTEYALEKHVYMRINYFNPEHDSRFD
jgi:hypothetical protein